MAHSSKMDIRNWSSINLSQTEPEVDAQAGRIYHCASQIPTLLNDYPQEKNVTTHIFRRTRYPWVHVDSLTRRQCWSRVTLTNQLNRAEITRISSFIVSITNSSNPTRSAHNTLTLSSRTGRC